VSKKQRKERHNYTKKLNLLFMKDSATVAVTLLEIIEREKDGIN
jgi:hypothetical protein